MIDLNKPSDVATNVHPNNVLIGDREVGFEFGEVDCLDEIKLLMGHVRNYASDPSTYNLRQVAFWVDGVIDSASRITRVVVDDFASRRIS